MSKAFDVSSTDAPGATAVIAPGEAAGRRLDKWLSEVSPAFSRSRVKALIEEGRLSVDGAQETDPKAGVIAGACYRLDPPPVMAATPQPEDIALDILHEDDELIVLVKPAGLVVHPAPGAWTGTLVNALLHHCGDGLTGIGGVARPGIVHRLDKETSGVMVVAKSERAHTRLVDMFAAHEIERAYLAVTRGAPRPLVGRIVTRIARSTGDRKKMAVVRERSVRPDPYSDDAEADAADAQMHGKTAITNYRTLETWGRQDQTGAQPAAALVECRLETGRTHQIRVHLAHIGAPVMGDPTYGKARGVKAFGAGRDFDHAVAIARGFRRQALHAAILGFEHPVTGEAMRFEAPPPDDLAELIAALRRF
ncbi:RluA family pseudouridine synthase [bacterium]|nr:RluA family pseudouridine synthase [bacterium]